MFYKSKDFYNLSSFPDTRLLFTAETTIQAELATKQILNFIAVFKKEVKLNYRNN